VTNHLCALRFFYIQTLKRRWSIADTPYPKKTHRLPTILSQEEVAQLIQAADTPFHRTILMTLYASGIRNAELTRLKVSDIDSQRMVIHIQDGKGRKDRDVMLSPVLLEELRAHWRGCANGPASGCFLGIPGTAAIGPSTPKRRATPVSTPPAAPALRTGFIPTCSVTIPRAELLPGNFVSDLFSTSSLAVMRHSLAPSIHRDRRKGVWL
jgi:integrase/recombinase XerD